MPLLLELLAAAAAAAAAFCGLSRGAPCLAPPALDSSPPRLPTAQLLNGPTVRLQGSSMDALAVSSVISSYEQAQRDGVGALLRCAVLFARHTRLALCLIVLLRPSAA